MAHFQLTILVKDKLKRISSNVLRVIIENKEQVGFYAADEYYWCFTSSVIINAVTADAIISLLLCEIQQV